MRARLLKSKKKASLFFLASRNGRRVMCALIAPTQCFIFNYFPSKTLPSGQNFQNFQISIPQHSSSGPKWYDAFAKTWTCFLPPPILLVAGSRPAQPQSARAGQPLGTGPRGPEPPCWRPAMPSSFLSAHDGARTRSCKPLPSVHANGIMTDSTPSTMYPNKGQGLL